MRMSLHCRAAILVLIVTSGTNAQVTVRTVVLNGRPAPDRPVGTTFSSFTLPRLSPDGKVAFEAVAGSRGIWAERTEGIRLSAIEGQSMTVDGAGYTLGIIGFTVAGVDTATFWGTYRGAASSHYAVLTNQGGSLRPLATERQVIPGTSVVAGEVNGSLEPVGTPSGDAAFYAGSCVVINRGGAVSAVAANSQATPGFPGGTFLGPRSQPTMNHQGLVAFTAGTQNTGFDEAIWLDNGTSLQARVTSATPAPGLPGMVFNGFAQPSINNAGQIAFLSATAGVSIWSEGSGSLGMVCRVGQQAPGTPDGTTFFSLEDPRISGSGATAFRARAGGQGWGSPSFQGVWRESAGVLNLLAREGEHAPGTPDGALFNMIYPPSMNSLGQTVIYATLTGEEVAPNSDGIWYAGSDGVLRRFIGTGDRIRITPRETRTIVSVRMVTGSGGQDGRPCAVNDRGEVAFWASFAGGTSGIFVAQLPEPSSLLLVVVGAGVLGRRVSHRAGTGSR